MITEPSTTGGCTRKSQGVDIDKGGKPGYHAEEKSSSLIEIDKQKKNAEEDGDGGLVDGIKPA